MRTRLALLLLFALACGDDDAMHRPDAALDATLDAPAADAGLDAGPLLPESWCERLALASQEGASGWAALAELHARVRHFGTEGAYSTVDEVLADTLDEPGTAGTTAAAIDAYAARLPSVCVVDPLPVPEAASRREGDVWVVVPGRGPLEAVPDDVDAVVVDLRDVPEHPELGAHLAQLVRATQSSEVTPLPRWVRHHVGSVDEVFSTDPARAIYETNLRIRRREPILAGERERMLAFWMGVQVAPTAARVAADLRAERRAWLLGHSLPIEVAEAEALGVGDRLGAVRALDLVQQDGETRLPDVVPADRPAFSGDVAELAGLGAPGPLDATPAERAALSLVRPVEDVQAPTSTRGRAHAGLLIAAGVLRLFYPYFPVVGDGLDARLEEVVDALPDEPGREAMMAALGRLTEVIDDGHVFLYDAERTRSLYPLLIDFEDGTPVVSAAAVDGLSVGDELLAIDGEDARDVLDAMLARTSAATLHYRRDLAMRRLLERASEVTVRTGEGPPRTVATPGIEREAFLAMAVTRFTRDDGPLDDLGAPDVHYVNLDGTVEEVRGTDPAASVREGLDARVMIVDMRGYPGPGAWTVMPQLAGGRGESPWFRVPEYFGPNDRSVQESDWVMESPIAYEGAIVLLTSPTTVSAAENLGQVLRHTRDITIVGRQSAATNGNITGTELPGGFAFTFTGMEILNRDRSVFHGVGLVPDVEVPLRAADLAAGRDAVFEEAVRIARGL